MSTLSSAPTDIFERTNLFQLYADVVWYGVLSGSTLSFISVYAARLGASALQMGLLSAGAAGVHLALSIHAGRWMEGRSSTAITYKSSLLHRAAYPIMAALPGLLAASVQIDLLIALSLLMSIPGTLLAISFNAMFAEIVPQQIRPRVVGRRNALLAISTILVLLGCGRILDAVIFPVNYQIVFGIGALGALLSSYHLGRIRAEARPSGKVNGPILGDLFKPGLLRSPDTVRQHLGLRYLTRAAGKPLLRRDLIRGPFGPTLLAYLLFHTFQFVPIPLYALFWTQTLGLPDGVISITNALFYGSMLVASLQLNRLSHRLGNRRLLLLGGSLFGLYPLLNGLASSPWLIWTAGASGGGIWALLNGAMTNQLLERIPADDRPAHMALYNVVLNLGTLAGALLGPQLAAWMSLREALLLSGFLRFLGGLALAFWA